jgi:hypothetical protein
MLLPSREIGGARLKPKSQSSHGQSSSSSNSSASRSMPLGNGISNPHCLLAARLYHFQLLTAGARPCLLAFPTASFTFDREHIRVRRSSVGFALAPSGAYAQSVAASNVWVTCRLCDQLVERLEAVLWDLAPQQYTRRNRWLSWSCIDCVKRVESAVLRSAIA